MALYRNSRTGALITVYGAVADYYSTQTDWEYVADGDPAPVNVGSSLGPAGPLVNRPAATQGTSYFATDDNGGTQYRSNGSTWVKVSPGVTEVGSGGGGGTGFTNYSQVAGLTGYPTVIAAGATQTAARAAIDVPATAAVVAKVDYNANTILVATADDTPAAMTVPASTLVGRLATGNIAPLTTVQAKTLLDVDDLETALPAEVTARTNADASLTARVVNLENAGSGGNSGAEARRLLASSVRLGNDRAVYVDPSGTAPTVTVTVGSVTTITGQGTVVRIAPKLVEGSTTAIDILNDPYFHYAGVPVGRLTVSSGDMCRPDLLTNGSAQAARPTMRATTEVYSSVYEFYQRLPGGTTFTYRIWVDDLPLSRAFTTVTGLTAGNRLTIRVNHADARNRRVFLEATDPEFGGIFVPITAAVRRPVSPRLTLAFSGDSHEAGANGVSRYETACTILSDLLPGVDVVNLSIGGSGYTNGGLASTSTAMRNRIPDVVAAAPDIHVMELGWNDSATALADETAEVNYVMGQLSTLLPATCHISAGPWIVKHTLDATLDSFDAMIYDQAQAAPNFYGHISFRDPRKLKRLTSPAAVPAWAVSTAYAVGRMVVANGLVWECFTSHTSAATGTIDTTKFRSTAIVTGTGKVGTTTGDGNADIFIQSDGIHSTLEAHSAKAYHLAFEILRILKATASGVTWAG